MGVYLKKITLFFLVMFLFSIIFTACLNEPTEPNSSSKNEPSSNSEDLHEKKPLKVGIVLSTGGKGDKSFNDSAIEGLDNAKSAFGIAYKDIQPRDVVDDEKSLDFLAKEGYNLIFGIGFMMKEALARVATKYPNTKFAIIDASYDGNAPKNVVELLFKEHQGSFLAGILAASMSKSKVIGFIGAMDVPLIRRFEGGFVAGVKYVIPDAKVLTNFVGSDSSAFNNPDKGKEIALDMISKGADYLYHASGGTGQGIFEAASTKDVKVIGVDSNQNWAKPGTVIASMLKRVDVAVGSTVKSAVEGSFMGGSSIVFGLAEDGVALTDLTELTTEEIDGLTLEQQSIIKSMKDSIPNEVKLKIEQTKKKIISGEIKVPDWCIEGRPKE